MMLKERETEVNYGQAGQVPILQNPNLTSSGGGVAETMSPQIQGSSEAMDVDEIYEIGRAHV